MIPARRGKIGVYGPKMRSLQRRVSFEVYGLSMKDANFYLYLGTKEDNPSINDLGCTIFNEAYDRLYSKDPVAIPVGVEMFQDQKMDFSRFGIINPMGDDNLFRFHIDDFQTLGREIVIGDVFELPFFEKDGRSSLWEVSDVDLRSEQERYIARVYAAPLKKSRTSAQIDINRDNDSIFASLDMEQQEVFSRDVPSLEHTLSETPPPASPVDIRDKEVQDFLDVDLNKLFR